MYFFLSFCFLFRDIIDEIKNDEDLQLCYVIADTPERHLLKGMVSHAGRFSCESCTAEATTKPGLHWPLETMKGALRQEETMKEATRYSKENLEKTLFYFPF